MIHALGASALAGLFVVSTLDEFELVFIVWTGYLTLVAFFLFRRKQMGLAFVVLPVQVVASWAVVVAAVLAPLKTRDRVLQGRVVLPSAERSLGELKAYAEGPGRRSFSTQIHVSFPAAQADHVIRWPGREISVKEFMAAIEEQTRLRCELGSCGNGSTILFGGNCVFGVGIWERHNPP